MYKIYFVVIVDVGFSLFTGVCAVNCEHVNKRFLLIHTIIYTCIHTTIYSNSVYFDCNEYVDREREEKLQL